MKFTLEQATKAQRWRYRSTLSLTSALDRVGGQCHAPVPLPPGKTRYQLYRRLGRPQGLSGQVRIISPPPGFDPPDRPARSGLLYRLSYPGPHVCMYIYIYIFFFSVALRPNAGHGFLIHVVSRSHTTTHHSR